MLSSFPVLHNRTFGWPRCPGFTAEKNFGGRPLKPHLRHYWNSVPHAEFINFRISEMGIGHAISQSDLMTIEK